MTATTAVHAVRIIAAAPPAGVDAHVATVTLQSGPFVVKGMRLFQAAKGNHYFKSPMMRSADDRVVIFDSDLRRTLLTQAVAMYRAMTQVHRAADTPLAPATENAEGGG